MKSLRLRWQGFWARRSRARIALTCYLLALTLAAIIWLVAPPEWRRLVQGGVASVAHWVSSLDTQTLVVALIGLCLAEGLALLLVPSYRKHGYLATAPRLIPPVSVYLDGENQHPDRAIKPFMLYLKKRLNGSRADLLYFQQAVTTVGTLPYRTLRRSGFQPIDVPHDPTGKGKMLEAVDREIAMHAFERAVLGPEKQLFIIISQDGDYVPLIYRLVALGHHVEIWASKPADALNEAQKYINLVPDGPGGPDDDFCPLKVIDLRDVIPEFRAIALSNVAPDPAPVLLPATSLANKQHASRSWHKPHPNGPARRSLKKRPRVPIPRTISTVGERQFYRAIMRTLEVHSETQQRGATEELWNMHFRGALGARLKQRLINLGYGDGIGTGLKYWLEHMSAVGVLTETQGLSFVRQGTSAPDDAARRMFAMARVAAAAASEIVSAHADGIVQTNEVANALASGQFSSDDLALPLVRLTMPDNSKRATHVRYFVRSARALGLLQFENVPGKPDAISYPRLPKPTSDVVEVTDDAVQSPASDAPDGPETDSSGGGIPSAE